MKEIDPPGEDEEDPAGRTLPAAEMAWRTSMAAQVMGRAVVGWGEWLGDLKEASPTPNVCSVDSSDRIIRSETG